MDNADLGPLDHALPPSKGPVHVFRTFIRLLLSALWSTINCCKFTTDLLHFGQGTTIRSILKSDVDFTFEIQLEEKQTGYTVFFATFFSIKKD